MVRSPSYDRNGMKKGQWSEEEEDDKLRAHVLKYGHKNWRHVPIFAGLARCGKSCRLRWVNYLKPGVRHGNFSQEEEDLIIRLQQVMNMDPCLTYSWLVFCIHCICTCRWSTIAQKLHGRTDSEIKNHWHGHLKKCNKGRKQSSDDDQHQVVIKDAGIVDDVNLADQECFDYYDDDDYSQELILDNDEYNNYYYYYYPWWSSISGITSPSASGSNEEDDGIALWSYTIP